MPSAVISEYCAVVVGGGPAGLTVVGNLMDNNLQRILWVDPSFDGGRVNAKYRNVPRYVFRRSVRRVMRS